MYISKSTLINSFVECWFLIPSKRENGKSKYLILGLKKLSSYGNPSYINAYEKLTHFQTYKDTAPEVYNNLISDISKDKFG